MSLGGLRERDEEIYMATALSRVSECEDVLDGNIAASQLHQPCYIRPLEVTTLLGYARSMEMSFNHSFGGAKD